MISENRSADGGKLKGRKRNRPTRVKTGARASVDGRRKTFTASQARALALADQENQLMRTNVRLLRTSLGWTQVHLAERCGWARTTIVRLESGESVPSYGQVCVIAKSLGVPIGVLQRDLSWLFKANAFRTFGEELRHRRIALNLTQQEAADRCGMTRTQYCDLEADKVPATHQQIVELSEAFGEVPSVAA